MQTKLEGVIENSWSPSYLHIVRIKPQAHHYEEPGEPEYIKWGCPVCELIGDRHQVTPLISQCPICNVNLDWSAYQQIENKEDLHETEI